MATESPPREFVVAKTSGLVLRLPVGLKEDVTPGVGDQERKQSRRPTHPRIRTRAPPHQRLRFNPALTTPSLAGKAHTATGACLPLGVTSPTCTSSPGIRPRAARVESER